MMLRMFDDQVQAGADDGHVWLHSEGAARYTPGQIREIARGLFRVANEAEDRPDAGARLDPATLLEDGALDLLTRYEVATVPNHVCETKDAGKDRPVTSSLCRRDHGGGVFVLVVATGIDDEYRQPGLTVADLVAQAAEHEREYHGGE